MKMNKIESINEKAIPSVENEKKEFTKESLLELLKRYLSNEMFDACFILIETPHFILKIFLGLFLLISHALNAFMTIQLILTYLQYSRLEKSRRIHPFYQFQRIL